MSTISLLVMIPFTLTTLKNDESPDFLLAHFFGSVSYICRRFDGYGRFGHGFSSFNFARQ